ncbi:MAG: hypothetical protein MZW92_41090 [Comamonadaceae bacterium]|nr:hypothetical protein [Comamonadaceae bacterium]
MSAKKNAPALDQAAQDHRPLAVAQTRRRQPPEAPLNSRGRARRTPIPRDGGRG